MLSTYTCFKCKHYNHLSNNSACKAFPDEIPVDIESGIIPHNHILKKQIGVYIYTELSERELDEIYKILEDKESEKSE